MHALRFRRLLLICVAAACAAVAATVLGTAGPADADLAGRIQTKQGRAEALRTAVAAETRRIRSSSRGLVRAQARLRQLQTDVAAQQAQLRSVEDALVQARNRLTRLVNRQRTATDALRENLVESYRNPGPDLVSVVITAHGFADLLEKADFLKRIARQNAEVMDAARTSRVAVAKQASRLGTMQARERSIAVRIERRRDGAQALENALLNERARNLAGRDFKRAELERVQRQLAVLRKRQARSARAGIRTDAGGAVQAPAAAPQAVALVIAAGNAIAGLPYVYGGGHGSFQANAYDCSGSVSYALAAAGLVNSPMASGPFMSWGDPGPGQWITVYANAGHAFMVVAGWRFDTSALPGGGTRWTQAMRGTAGFVARHPPGL
jgi:cell wall-associated NlpC family hydrolase